MRKTSDIAMLLGARGKSRSRSSRRGVFSPFLGVIDGVLGYSGKRRRKQRKQNVPAMVFAVAVIAAFGGGFLVGGQFADAAGDDPLRARVGRAPDFVNERLTEKLADQGYVVAIYDPAIAGGDAEAKQDALNLAKYLQGMGLEKSRALLWNTQEASFWVTVVYYEGDAERDGTKDQLLNLPEDVPCQEFASYRSDSGWPADRKIE